MWTYAWSRAVQDKATKQDRKKKRLNWREEVAQIVNVLATASLTDQSTLSIAIVRRVRTGDLALEFAKCKGNEPYSTFYLPIETTPSLMVAMGSAYSTLAREKGRILDAEKTLFSILAELDNSDPANPNPAGKPKRK